jgi:hypothetical protein
VRGNPNCHGTSNRKKILYGKETFTIGDLPKVDAKKEVQGKDSVFSLH